MRQTCQIKNYEFVDAANLKNWLYLRPAPRFLRCKSTRKSTRHDPIVRRSGLPLQGVVVGHSHGAKASTQATCLCVKIIVWVSCPILF
jgi:hypothetical protein